MPSSVPKGRNIYYRERRPVEESQRRANEENNQLEFVGVMAKITTATVLLIGCAAFAIVYTQDDGNSAIREVDPSPQSQIDISKDSKLRKVTIKPVQLRLTSKFPTISTTSIKLQIKAEFLIRKIVKGRSIVRKDGGSEVQRRMPQLWGRLMKILPRSKPLLIKLNPDSDFLTHEFDSPTQAKDVKIKYGIGLSDGIQVKDPVWCQWEMVLLEALSAPEQDLIDMSQGCIVNVKIETVEAQSTNHGKAEINVAIDEES